MELLKWMDDIYAKKHVHTKIVSLFYINIFPDPLVRVYLSDFFLFFFSRET